MNEPTGPDLRYAALAAWLNNLPDVVTFDSSCATCPLARLAISQGFHGVSVTENDISWWAGGWSKTGPVVLGCANLDMFAREFIRRFDGLRGDRHRLATVKRLLAALAPEFGPQEVTT